MTISLADLQKVNAGISKVTGNCKYCDVSVVDGAELCASCKDAPATIEVSLDPYEYGFSIFPTDNFPTYVTVEYVRADLVEKMKGE